MRTKPVIWKPEMSLNDTGSETKRMTRRRFLAATLATGAAAPLSCLAQENGPQVRLALGEMASKAVPLSYQGFSYENAQLADPSFFAPDNEELVSLFRALSPEGVLRLGGNSSDYCWWKASPDDRPPELPEFAQSDENWMPHAFTAIEPAAIDRLADFLDATGWKVIYGLSLGTGTAERDAEEAAYVAQRLGPHLLYFQIGNEPEYYRNSNNRLRGQDWDFEKYLTQWVAFARAVIARVPDARFGGPDVGSNVQWVVNFAEEAPKHLPGRIEACTSHYYLMGPPDDPRTTMARLLASDPRVDRDARRIMSAANQTHIHYRMTEGNSCYRGGKPGVSDAFGSALWAADYLLKLASYGCTGVNLHGGSTQVIRSALGGHLPGEQFETDTSAVATGGTYYTPIAGNREMGFVARPVFYGMKLAGVLCGGKMRPVQLAGSNANTTAWAAEMADGTTRLVLLNKDAQQTLDLAIPSSHDAKLWRLEAPSLTATSGVTLAGASIEPGTPWRPQREETLVSKDGQVRVLLPAGSGAALFFEGSIS